MFANVREGATPWERWPPEKQPAVRKAKELWSAVEANAHVPSVHAEFVAFCRNQAIADFGAMRYRHFVADRPDEPLGRQYLEESVRNAHASAAIMLGSGKSTGMSADIRRLRLIVGGAIVFVTVVLFVYAIRFYLASARLS